MKHLREQHHLSESTRYARIQPMDEGLTRYARMQPMDEGLTSMLRPAETMLSTILSQGAKQTSFSSVKGNFTLISTGLQILSRFPEE